MAVLWGRENEEAFQRLVDTSSELILIPSDWNCSAHLRVGPVFLHPTLIISLLPEFTIATEILSKLEESLHQFPAPWRQCYNSKNQVRVMRIASTFQNSKPKGIIHSWRDYDISHQEMVGTQWWFLPQTPSTCLFGWWMFLCAIKILLQE